VERFLMVDLQGIDFLEAASLTSVQFHGGGDVIETFDYLDCAVEHLSIYWKMAGPSAYNRTAAALSSFAARKSGAPKRRRRGADALRFDTVCAVPFYANRDGDDLAKGALAATLASLDAVFGRIVVTVSTPFDEKLARDVLQGSGSFSFEIVTLVSKNSKMLPKATLLGLQRALRGEGGAELWLGETRPKYVYFTESDSVLHLRRPANVRAALDAAPISTIVVPHRLQGIPVENLSNVTVKWADAGASCLDTGAYPAFETHWPKCDNFWYRCDGGRFAAYGLLRLRSGTGLTVLSGTEHGRQCVLSTQRQKHHRPDLPTLSKETPNP
jgi:hypothetical protein